MPPPTPPRLPSGGSVCCAGPVDEFLLERLRLNVVPGPEPNPLAASSSTLDTDFSILLSSLRTHVVLAQASTMS